MTTLTALDSAFLRLEDAAASLHIASIAVLDGPPPLHEQVTELIAAKLPVHLADPVARLHAVHRQTTRLKHWGEPQGGDVLGQLASLLPGPLVSLGLAGLFRIPQRMLVNMTTNVPGPAVPRYALGRRLREPYPWVPIADHIRVAVAVTSYDGGFRADKGLAELTESKELQR